MGIMCASQVAVLLACFSYQKIRGVFMIYRECVGVSHLSKRTCFTYLVSVRLIFFFFKKKKVFIYMMRSLNKSIYTNWTLY